MAVDCAPAPIGFLGGGVGERQTAVVVGAIVVVAAALHLALQLTGDVSWLLTVCERMLAGQTLYVDIIELNPPMSAWLYMPWVWLAPRIGLAPETLVTLATIGVGLFALAASARTLTAAGLLESAAGWWIVGVFVFVLSPMDTFAQREHFAVMAALPMLAAVACRAEGRAPDLTGRVVAGLCGGFAMAVKPHFALAVLLPVIYAAVRRRSLRPVFTLENVVAGVVVTLYGTAVVTLHPAYFTEMLPLANAIYVPNRAPLAALLTAPPTLILAFVTAAWAIRRDIAGRPLFLTLGAATFGFFVAFLVQGRGWSYHLLPASSLSALAFGLALSIRRPDRATERAADGIGLIVVTLLLIQPFGQFFRFYDYDGPLRRALASLGPNLKIALVSPDLAVASPLHRSLGATLVNRGPSLWLAGNANMVCKGEIAPERLAACRAAVARDRVGLRDDLRRWRPDVVLAETRRGDWLDWARNDPETAAILDGYRLLDTVELQQFRTKVLVRKDRM